MRQYLLDTGPMAALLHNRVGAVSRFTPWVHDRLVATSMLVYGEVNEYLLDLSDYPRRHTALKNLLRIVTPFVPTYAIMNRYAQLRRQLRPPHGPGLIGDVDTLIAATAMEHNLTLITIDTDFTRVPGLSYHLLTPQDLRQTPQ